MADVDIDSLLEEGLTKKPSPTKMDKDDTEKGKENAKDKDRRKSRSRSRSRERRRSRRSRSRSRDRRKRSRSRERRRSRRSRSRERRRSRSRSRDRRRRSTSNSRGRSRRSRKSRSASKSPSPVKKEREPSTSMERAIKAKERELAELTRDHRTVFVSQLQIKVTDKQVRKFFEQIGPVVKVTLLKDKYTNKSKGLAYVEMQNLEDIPKCLLVHGLVPDFQVFPLAVKASEAEKNYAAKLENSNNTHAAMSGGASTTKKPESSAASRLYVGNLHVNVTEETLKNVFETIAGEVMSVNINKDETGRSRGFGFVQFFTVHDAKVAMSKAQGMELSGKHLKIGPVNDSNSGSATVTGGGGSWKLDDDEGSGLNLNAMSRTALMAKLAGGVGKELAQSAPGGVVPGLAPANQASAPTPQAPTTPEGQPSRCFVVQNMFDPETETEPNWDIEIREDTIEECSKYGKVTHCHVDKNLKGGFVYLLFENQAAAEACAKSLHGRWFARRMITIRFMHPGEYSTKFPNSFR